MKLAFRDSSSPCASSLAPFRARLPTEKSCAWTKLLVSTADRSPDKLRLLSGYIISAFTFSSALWSFSRLPISPRTRLISFSHTTKFPSG